ncbi:MAG TPA: MFS transporter [Anaerolineales bacterium]|nr:MFS transporter [Anaerolineales bacterium]
MGQRLPRNVWALSITSFLTDISSEMLFNLLPLFLANVLGVGTAVVGLIEGVAETTASLLKVYSGALSDRLGKRKTLTVLGYGLSTLVKPFLYFASSWGWVLGVRFSDRVGKGIRSAPRDALLAGSIPPDRRGLAFGLHRAADTAGAFTGLGIAALIIWATQAGSAQLTRQTFQIVVLASVIPAALGVLVLALGAREIASPTGETAAPRLTLSGLDRRFRAFLVAVVLFTLGNSADAFIILRAQERGLSVLQVMGMLLTFNAVYTLLSIPAGSLSDRVGRRRVLLAGWLLYGLVYLGFAAARSGVQIWLLYAVYGVYYALTEGTARALVADLVPQAQRGTAYGLFHAGVGFAALPASLIAGVLWQGVGRWAGFGPAAPFFFGAALALLAGRLLWGWVK